VIDIRDPAHPSEVGHCDTPDYARSVVFADGVAYVADDVGVCAVSAQDPSHPQVMACYSTAGQAWSVTQSGGYVYVAVLQAGLVVLRRSGF